MKKIYTLFLGLTLLSAAQAQSVLLEDFEGGSLPAGWTLDQVAGSNGWEFGTAGSLSSGFWTIPGTNPTMIVASNDDNCNCDASEDRIITPPLDFTGLTTVELTFDSYYSNSYSATVEVSTDGGGSWTIVETLPTNGAWTTVNTSLSAYAGMNNVLVAFHHDDLGAWAYGWAIDNVNIYSPVPYDAILTSINAPVTNCGLSSSEIVEFEVLNGGEDTIFTMDLCYVLDAAAPVCETFNDTILPGATEIYTFSTTADLSAFAMYNFDGYVTLAGDASASNDTILGYMVENLNAISSFPYLEDFESGQGNWTINNNGSGNWEFGTPANTVINSAESGVNAFVTGLNGPYNNNFDAYVESPCFDFVSATGQEVFAMDIWIESEDDWDGANVTYSVDGGASWQLLGSIAGAQPINNWYISTLTSESPGGYAETWNGYQGNGSNGWIQANFPLDSATFVGNAAKFRVNFGSDGSFNGEGFAFDNVAIAYPITADIYPDSAYICDTAFATNLTPAYDDATWSDGQTGPNVLLDNSGSYDVIAYDIYGMYALDTFIIELNEDYVAPNLGPDRVLCFGNTEVLDAGAEPGNQYTYIWNDASTDTTLQISAGGIYAVTKTDTTGCAETDSVTITMPAAAELGNSTQGFCAGDMVTLDPGIANGQYLWNTGDMTATIAVSTAGPYSVTVTDSLGCVTTDAVSLLESNPMPNLGNDPTVLCVNTNATLDPGTFDSYSWSTGDNTATLLVQGNVYGLGAHNFSVTVTDSIGCTATSNVTIQFEDCVGINEITSAELSIYPNPSSDGVFNYTIDGVSGEFNMYVTDIAGKRLTAVSNESAITGVIDLSTYERGIYFLNIEADGSRKTVRLIKQ